MFLLIENVQPKNKILNT